MAGVDNNDIATLGLAGAVGYGGFGYGYGRSECDTRVGNNILGTQNFFNGQRIEGVKDAVINTAALGDIRDQSRFIDIDNKIDRQSVALEARLNSFESTYNSDKKAELLAQNSVLQTQLNMKEGCVPTTCSTCSSDSSSIDVNSIQIAVGQGIVQAIPTLVAAMSSANS